jgi:uncharacterized membrane protein YeaQ/YmgE (transglycosylase-associated protein family)
MNLTVGEIIVWIIVGALAGSVVGMVVKRKKEGFGRWANLGIGLAGAVIGGGLFNLLGIDLGLGQLAITFDDLLAAFVGSLIFLVALWIYQRRAGARAAADSAPPPSEPQ